MQDNKEMVKFAQRYVESFKGAVVDQAGRQDGQGKGREEEG